jgi:hypothetical protein
MTEPVLVIEYRPLSWCVQWDKNPKQHDIGLLTESFKRHGFRDAPIWDDTLGALVAGNGRITALQWMCSQDFNHPPEGIIIQEGEWCVPIQFGINSPSKTMAEAFAIDHNNLVMSGGDLTAVDMSRVWSVEYVNTLAKIVSEGGKMLTVDGDDIDMLLRANAGGGGGQADADDRKRKPMIRITIDNPAAWDNIIAGLKDLSLLHPDWGMNIK